MEDAAGAGADELPPLSVALDAQTDVIDTKAQHELLLRQQRLIHHQLQQVDVQHGGVKPEFESWLNAQPCNLGGILPMKYSPEQIELMVWQYKATHGLLPVQQSSHASRSLQSDAAQRHQQEFSQAGQQQVSPAIPYGQQMGELHKQYSVPHGQGQHVQQPSSLVEPDDAQRPQQEHGQAGQHQMPGQHQMQYHATLPTLPLNTPFNATGTPVGADGRPLYSDSGSWLPSDTGSPCTQQSMCSPASATSWQQSPLSQAGRAACAAQQLFGATAFGAAGAMPLNTPYHACGTPYVQPPLCSSTPAYNGQMPNHQTMSPNGCGMSGSDANQPGAAMFARTNDFNGLPLPILPTALPPHPVASASGSPVAPPSSIPLQQQPPTASKQQRKRLAKDVVQQVAAAKVPQPLKGVVQLVNEAHGRKTLNEHLIPIGFPRGPFDCDRDALLGTVNAFTNKTSCPGGGFKVTPARADDDPKGSGNFYKVSFRCTNRLNNYQCKWEVGYHLSCEGWVLTRYSPDSPVEGDDSISNADGIGTSTQCKCQHKHPLHHDMTSIHAAHAGRSTCPQELIDIGEIMAHAGAAALPTVIHCHALTFALLFGRPSAQTCPPGVARGSRAAWSGGR